MSSEKPHSDLAQMVKDGPVAVICMRREEKRNALSAALIVRLTELVTNASKDPEIRGIVLTGGSQMFSAGADLAEAVAIESIGDFEPFAERAALLLRAIEESPKPVIAAISGPCMTGGLELALACDERIASSDAVFAMTSAAIGSVAGFGGTQRLPRLIGSPAAKRMMFSARRVDGDEAYILGLVDELVDDPIELARMRIEEYACSAPLSVSLTKRAVNAGMQVSLEAGLEFERALCARAFSTHDKLEGMLAFLEKRTPRFEGR